MHNEHNESREDYLESILILKKKYGAVRSIDIADYFNYSRPSISLAMSILRTDGLITMNRNGYIELTDDGRKIAESVYTRHKILIAFLKQLGVSEESAADDACRIEHVLSDESIQRITEFVKTNESNS